MACSSRQTSRMPSGDAQITVLEQHQHDGQQAGHDPVVMGVED